MIETKEDKYFLCLQIAKSHNKKLLHEIGVLQSEVEELKYNLKKTLDEYSVQKQKLSIIAKSDTILELNKKIIQERQRANSYSEENKRLKNRIKEFEKTIDHLLFQGM